MANRWFQAQTRIEIKYRNNVVGEVTRCPIVKKLYFQLNQSRIFELEELQELLKSVEDLMKRIEGGDMGPVVLAPPPPHNEDGSVVESEDDWNIETPEEGTF